ncbi:hypothetical protein [Streptomyces chartreusis]
MNEVDRTLTFQHTVTDHRDGRIVNATGRRIRELPITPEAVL